MDSPWNSLELTKIIISTITPIIGGIIAWHLAKIGKDIENKQWTDRKIIEKRLEIYEKLVPKLNDLYCFYMKIGNWKEITPLRIIELKRELDKDFNIYNHLFQWDILKEYNTLIGLCFATYSGEGHDAKIKTKFENREDFVAKWEEEWADLFLPGETTEKEAIKKSYDRLIEIFRRELNLI